MPSFHINIVHVLHLNITKNISPDYAYSIVHFHYVYLISLVFHQKSLHILYSVHPNTSFSCIFLFMNFLQSRRIFLYFFSLCIIFLSEYFFSFFFVNQHKLTLNFDIYILCLWVQAFVFDNKYVNEWKCGCCLMAPF